jgi:hypothetical protein
MLILALGGSRRLIWMRLRHGGMEERLVVAVKRRWEETEAHVHAQVFGPLGARTPQNHRHRMALPLTDTKRGREKKGDGESDGKAMEKR